MKLENPREKILIDASSQLENGKARGVLYPKSFLSSK
jgi:hypothetical protein